jgi:hypothetical protein
MVHRASNWSERTAKDDPLIPMHELQRPLVIDGTTDGGKALAMSTCPSKGRPKSATPIAPQLGQPG